MNVSGLSYGNATITICQNSGGQCATVYVTVSYNGGGYPNPNSPSLITFSQTNPALSVSQSMNISLYGSTNDGYYNGSNGYYYIGYNSNSNSLQATISGSNLSLQGLAAGNVVVVVCSSATNCAALTATVGGTTVVPTGTGNWYPCASENQFCSFSGTQTVQYGANGVYVYKTLANGTTCSNAVFGDPIFGIAKRCNISY